MGFSNVEGLNFSSHLFLYVKRELLKITQIPSPSTPQYHHTKNERAPTQQWQQWTMYTMMMGRSVHRIPYSFRPALSLGQNSRYNVFNEIEEMVDVGINGDAVRAPPAGPERRDADEEVALGDQGTAGIALEHSRTEGL